MLALLLSRSGRGGLTDEFPSLCWLHISDFHFQAGDPYDSDVVLNALLLSLPSLSERIQAPDFIVASGDIAYSGKVDEYSRATEFFDNLLKVVSLPKERLLVIPGNHDIERSRGIGLDRTLSSALQADQYFSQTEGLPHAQYRLKNFSDWYNSYFIGIRAYPLNNTCSSGVALTINDIEVNVLPINSALFCIDDADNGKLWMGRRCVETAIRNFPPSDRALRLALVHHPLDWLHQAERPNITTLLRDYFDVILTGHLHEGDMENISGLLGSCIHLSAGATYQTRKYPNTSMYCTYKRGIISVHPIKYEDRPRPVWTIDSGLFIDSPDYSREFRVERLEPQPLPQSAPAAQGYTPDVVDQAGSSLSEILRADFERDLFRSREGELIYAPPRIMRHPHGSIDVENTYTSVPLSEIVTSPDTFIIETQSEYGATTLARRLRYEFEIAGMPALLRDARHIPTHRKKLEAEFSDEKERFRGQQLTLILDNVDVEAHERRLREALSIGLFGRLILISPNRKMSLSRAPDFLNAKYSPTILYLWPMSRHEIRTIVSLIFSSQDDVLISTIVDKIYFDLLGLCIPLTHANVIMYSNVLLAEGNFHPLNRVDIVGRYINEILRRPSDAYSGSFNAKNKIDVLARFCHRLFLEKRPHFDHSYWQSFMSGYKNETLTAFDELSFFQDLLDARIFVNVGRDIYFKYNFFFTFFLGKYLSAKHAELDNFIANKKYTEIHGVVDVVTGLSSDNSALFRALVQDLSAQIIEYESRFLPVAEDPLNGISWTDNVDEEALFWQPIENLVSKGPRETKDIDNLKHSPTSEARTANQAINFDSATKLENTLFRVCRLLCDALRNADDVDGEDKLRAIDAIFKCAMIMFQVGTALESVIERNSYVRWGSLAFINSNHSRNRALPSEPNRRLPLRFSIGMSVARNRAENVGSSKLTPIFAKWSETSSGGEYFSYVNFRCLIQSRGAQWAEPARKIIENTDKNSIYLRIMLIDLISILRDEVIPTRDRDSVKDLIAFIRAKRKFNKQSPGRKAIGAIRERIDESGAITQLPPSRR